MENQGMNKSKIVNGKILEFAQTILKERMQKQQSNIEGEISALMKENEKHKEWFDAIVQSKPQLPNGVMKYEDIIKKMNNSTMSLKDWLDEKIREEYEKKMSEEIKNQVADKIEQAKSNIWINADAQIRIIKIELDAKNRENDLLKKRNADLIQELHNKDDVHEEALKEISEQNLTSQQKNLLTERQKNSELETQIILLKEQLESENATLQQKYDNSSRENYKLIIASGELQDKNENLQDKNSKLQDENSNLERLYDIAIAELRKKDKEISNLNAQLNSVNAQLATSLEKVSSIEIQKKTFDDAQAKNNAEKANCQQKIMELTKTIVFLQIKHDFELQKIKNVKTVQVPPTPTPTPTPTINTKPRTDPRKKITLFGGSNKSEIFMKGGKLDQFGYDDEEEIIVVFNKDQAHIGQYPKPSNYDDYVVYLTEKEIHEYNNRTTISNKELEKCKTTSEANAKLMTELILIKTKFSIIHNNFLSEKIANMTNQQIIKSTNAANKNLISENATLKGENKGLTNTNSTLKGENKGLTNAKATLEGENKTLKTQLNATALTANTATAISKASTSLPRNPNVFKSDNDRVMFSELKQNN
jgi:hypothetical protein